MWNQSCVKERQTERERCAWAGNKQIFFFNTAGKATAISLH